MIQNNFSLFIILDLFNKDIRKSYVGHEGEEKKMSHSIVLVYNS